MEPIIPWWVIYLADISTPVRVFAILGGVFVPLFAGVVCIDGGPIPLPLFKKIFYISLACLIAGVLIPTKEAMYLMLATHYITPDNLAAFGGSIKEFIDYLLEGIAGIVQGGD